MRIRFYVCVLDDDGGGIWDLGDGGIGDGRWEDVINPRAFFFFVSLLLEVSRTKFGFFFWCWIENL